MEKEFKTPNAYLAATILLETNQAPKFETTNGWTSFVFPKTGEVLRTVDLFNGGTETVNVARYVEVLKRLRSEVYVRKSL